VRVIVLAAGTGSRLGSRTLERPKPALAVAGEPLLAYDVRFARAAGATSVVVVTGYRHEVTDPIARDHGADTVLHNPRFADAGNLETLTCARRAGLCDLAFLVMNADHIYRPIIAARVAEVAAAATQITAFVDRDRILGPDDMKVRLDDEGHVVAIGKQLDSWDAGYVGLTFVPSARVEDYFRHADNVALEKGAGIHVEAVLGRMVGVDPAASVDVSGLGWLEIDDETDLRRAEEVLAREKWY
jgi:choline kinase